MKHSAKYIAVNACVAALYVATTMPLTTIATNPYIQFRPGEALTVLPAVMPYCVPGLVVGCAISNIVSAFGIFDIVLGSLVTLVAALLTAFVFRNIWLAPLPPILLNAIALPLIWLLGGGESGIVSYLLQAGGLVVSQSVVCYGLGVPLTFAVRKKVLPLLDK